MFNNLAQSVGLPLIIGYGLSLGVDALLKPQPLPFWQRSWATFSLHGGLYLLGFAFELVLWQRPWFAMTMLVAFLLLIVQISNVKFQTLREPFIWQDFDYFTDALKHPRLYIPFLGTALTVLLIVGFGLVVYVGLQLESALTFSVFLLTAGVLLLIGFGLLWLGEKQDLSVNFNPEADLQHLGLLSCLWRYRQQERVLHTPVSPYSALAVTPPSPSDLPHIVVVQSESFFDARRLSSTIRTDVLQHIDTLKTQAVCHGQLSVSAWGANTVRTEFAFLSGLASDVLGVHRFNPYRKLAQQGVFSLAGMLQQQGYRTVCVHPFHASFYNRHRVMPALGFDEFIDLRQFAETEKTGPYIGDQAVADKVCDLLSSSTAQAVFVFVITMENHGPLHLEKVQSGEVERLYTTPPPPKCEDLTIYLRHLQNADRMAAQLQSHLMRLSRPSYLAWYGDHVPIMPTVYQAMTLPSGQTDYFIWGSLDASGKRVQLDWQVENLGLLLLAKMGFLAMATHL